MNEEVHYTVVHSLVAWLRGSDTSVCPWVNMGRGIFVAAAVSAQSANASDNVDSSE